MLRIKTNKISIEDNSIIDHRTLVYKLYTDKTVCQKFLKVWRYVLENTPEPMEILEEYPASVASLETLNKNLRQGCEQVKEEYPHLPLPDNWKKSTYSQEDLNILHDGFVEVCKADLWRAKQENEIEDLRLLNLLETINIAVHKIESKMLYAKTNQTPPYIQSLSNFEFDDLRHVEHHQPLTREEAQESYDVTYSQKNCLIIANQILGKSLEAISMDDDYKSLLETEHESHFVPKTTIKTGMSMFIAKAYCECCGQLHPIDDVNDQQNKYMLDWCEKNNVADSLNPTHFCLWSKAY